jgi:uncharacterized protein
VQYDVKSNGNPEAIGADPLVSRVIAFCCRYAYSVVLLAAVLAGAAAIYVTNNISIDTDSTKLISPDLPWRQRDARFDADFSQSVD